MEAAGYPDSVAPPLEAYRYWPSREAVCYGQDKQLVRFIFYKVAFTDYEEEQYSLFEQYMQTNYPAFQYPDWIVKQERIRLLLSCKFSFKKAAQAVFSAIEWRDSFLPFSYFSLFGVCQGVLNTGAIYIHGRDHRYRPLLVLNIAKLDLERHTVAEYRGLICFLLEFMIQKMMIPGQVENWVVVTDLANRRLLSLPVSELKQLIRLLQDNFRCRMWVNYIVNAPTALMKLWAVKSVIEGHTLKKLRVLKSAPIEEMKSHFALHQYEKKYGGTAPNAELFWPPILPPAPFHSSTESPEGHLADRSSFNDYFPDTYTSAISPAPETDVSGEVGSKGFRPEFSKTPLLKQETDEVLDPELVAVHESVSLDQTTKPLRPRRRCCPKSKCTLS